MFKYKICNKRNWPLRYFTKAERSLSPWAIFILILLLLPCQGDAALTKIGSYDTPNFANGVAVSGIYAYVADGYSGLRIIDISNPSSPIEVGSYDTGIFSGDVKVSGSYAYVAFADALRIIDISNPSAPTQTGFYPMTYAWSVVISGNYAYVADYDSGLRIIDVSNPAAPVEVGYYITSGRALDVAISGNYAYVAADDVGLRIIDISNVATPSEVGFCDTPSIAYGVAVSGSHAYVADGYSGLQIIDISNPFSPAIVGFYDTDCTWDVAVSGNYAYMADYGSGLRVIDVSNPISPIQVDSYDTPSLSFDVTVSGNYIYVADYESGLQILADVKWNDDLSVNKIAILNGTTISQVGPGQTFNYNITVTNKDLINDAPLVLVTDKLPYDVEYIGAEVYPALPVDYTISQSGDLVYVKFDQIPSGSTRYINLTVKAPESSPTTLYNTVNLRYRADQNTADNSMTISTYVVQSGYNQTEAAKSFEDLLHNQSQLLFQFEDLLHTVPDSNVTNYTFLVSFEQLLRSQANLTSSFEDLLTNDENTRWDEEYTAENRTYLLWSYEQMLYDEAFLFASFNMKMEDSWDSLCNYTAPGHTQNAQTELTASLEDLLKRQTRLYKSFNLLLDKIDISDSNELMDFLAAYENLLRIEANLFKSFNERVDETFVQKCVP